MNFFKRPNFHKALTLLVLVCFLSASTGMPSYASTTALNLPAPGTMVSLSSAFNPVILKGIKIDPSNPLRFDFIVDPGQENLEADEFKDQSTKLIRYFLASLTVPEKDLWVNLSPYEKDRIVSNEFGSTEMGRDLLAQDYILKQLTASLIYPENSLGKEFWDRVYKKAQEQYGTTQIPVNTFNKVWVVPAEAGVYKTKDAAFVTKAHLKVMLEGDYLALSKNDVGAGFPSPNKGEEASPVREIVRQIILPELEKEVNEGKNFVQLRQIYNSLILAIWFKRNLKASVLGKVYVGQNKVDGVDIEDKNQKQKIYEQYLQAYKKGVFNFIKEDLDQPTQQRVPRKYFSGGVTFIGDAAMNTAYQDNARASEVTGLDHAMRIQVDMTPVRESTLANKFDQAMTNVPKVGQTKDVNLKADQLTEREWTAQFTNIIDGFNTESIATTNTGWKSLDWKLEELIREGLGPNENLESYQRIGQALRERWQTRGLDKEIGSLNTYLSLMISMAGLKPHEFKTVVNRVDYLTKTDNAEDRRLALWANGVNLAFHLRSSGMHAENMGEGQDPEFLDTEVLVKNVREYIPLLLMRDHKDFSDDRIPSGKNYRGEAVSMTYRELLLWGLIVMLDPMIYDYFSGRPQIEGTGDEQYIDVTEYVLNKWPGRTPQMVKFFLSQLLDGLTIKTKDGIIKKITDQELDALLTEAFSLFAGSIREERLKDLRSPFEVYIVNLTDSIRNALINIRNPDRRAFPVISDVFSVALDRHFISNSVGIAGMSEYFSTSSARTGGSWDGYGFLARDPFKTRFPRLAKLLYERNLEVQESQDSAMIGKLITEGSINAGSAIDSMLAKQKELGSITFSTVADPETRYQIVIDEDFMQRPAAFAGIIDEPKKIVYVITPNAKGALSHPIAFLNGLFDRENGAISHQWGITIDYEMIWKRLQDFSKQGASKKSLFESLSWLSDYNQNPSEAAQMRFLYRYLDKILLVKSNENIQEFFADAPRDLRRKGIFNGLLEFITSFAPLGHQMMARLGNEESLAMLKEGKTFAQTPVGTMWAKVGYDLEGVVSKEFSGFPRFVITKKRQPKVQSLWSNPNALGPYVDKAMTEKLKNDSIEIILSKIKAIQDSVDSMIRAMGYSPYSSRMWLIGLDGSEMNAFAIFLRGISSKYGYDQSRFVHAMTDLMTGILSLYTWRVSRGENSAEVVSDIREKYWGQLKTLVDSIQEQELPFTRTLTSPDLWIAQSLIHFSDNLREFYDHSKALAALSFEGSLFIIGMNGREQRAELHEDDFKTQIDYLESVLPILVKMPHGSKQAEYTEVLINGLLIPMEITAYKKWYLKLSLKARYALYQILQRSGKDFDLEQWHFQAALHPQDELLSMSRFVPPIPAMDLLSGHKESSQVLKSLSSRNSLENHKKLQKIKTFLLNLSAEDPELKTEIANHAFKVSDQAMEGRQSISDSAMQGSLEQFKNELFEGLQQAGISPEKLGNYIDAIRKFNSLDANDLRVIDAVVRKSAATAKYAYDPIALIQALTDVQSRLTNLLTIKPLRPINLYELIQRDDVIGNDQERGSIVVRVGTARFVINKSGVQRNKSKIAQIVLNLQDAVDKHYSGQWKDAFLSGHLSYFQISGLPEFNFLHIDVLFLMALGKYLDFWEIGPTSDSNYGIKNPKMKKIREAATSDSAMKVSPTGGIDFQADQLKIDEQGGDVNVPTMDVKDLENMNIRGFIPVIINIVPVTNIPELLGLLISDKKLV